MEECSAVSRPIHPLPPPQRLPSDLAPGDWRTETDPHFLLRVSPSVYQGLIPWAWIEASTKGAVLLFSAAEIESASVSAGVSPALAGLLGGMGGGVCQAYATMGQSVAPRWAGWRWLGTCEVGCEGGGS